MSENTWGNSPRTEHEGGNGGVQDVILIAQSLIRGMRDTAIPALICDISGDIFICYALFNDYKTDANNVCSM